MYFIQKMYFRCQLKSEYFHDRITLIRGNYFKYPWYIFHIIGCESKKKYCNICTSDILYTMLVYSLYVHNNQQKIMLQNKFLPKMDNRSQALMFLISLLLFINQRQTFFKLCETCTYERKREIVNNSKQIYVIRFINIKAIKHNIGQ